MNRYRITYKYTDIDGCDLQIDDIFITSDTDLSQLLSVKQHEMIINICRAVVQLSEIYAAHTVQLVRIEKEQGS